MCGPLTADIFAVLYSYLHEKETDETVGSMDLPAFRSLFGAEVVTGA